MAGEPETVGGDVVALADAIGHDVRIGRRFLNAGIGFGGGCLPKDIRAFQARAAELGATSRVHVVGPLVGDQLAAAHCSSDGFVSLDDLAGKKISVSIGFSPVGIGYDTYGRVLARHMPRHLPGNPTMVAENKPGAGSMTLLNYLYNAAPRDGTEFSVVGRGAPMDALLTGAKTTAPKPAPEPASATPKSAASKTAGEQWRCDQREDQPADDQGSETTARHEPGFLKNVTWAGDWRS